MMTTKIQSAKCTQLKWMVFPTSVSLQLEILLQGKNLATVMVIQTGLGGPRYDTRYDYNFQMKKATDVCEMVPFLLIIVLYSLVYSDL